MAAVKASEARGDPPLLRAVEVARLVAGDGPGAGAGLPSAELAGILVSNLCFAHNSASLWKLLDQAMSSRLLCPLHVLALLTARVLPHRRAQPEAYRLYLELLKSNVTSSSLSLQAGPNRDKMTKAIDAALQLSKIYGVPKMDFGHVVILFVLSVTTRLIDCILEDCGFPSEGQDSVYPVEGPHAMDVDVKGVSAVKHNEHREQLRRKNTVMALEVLHMMAADKKIQAFLRLICLNMPDKFSALSQRLTLIEARKIALERLLPTRHKIDDLLMYIRRVSNVDYQPNNKRLVDVLGNMRSRGSLLSQLTGAGRAACWIIYDIYLENAIDGKHLSAISAIVIIKEMTKTAQAINEASWQETFKALWIAALRLVQRAREPLEGPIPHLDARLCMLLALIPLAIAAILKEETDAHGSEGNKNLPRRLGLVSSLQDLVQYSGLLVAPSSVVNAANAAASKAAIFRASCNAAGGNPSMIGQGDSSTKAVGNMLHLIVEACISRNLIDTTAYLWPGYIVLSGHLKDTVLPQESPWLNFMQGAPLSDPLKTALISTPASSVAELDKLYHIALNGSEQEKSAAAKILCGASLVRGWNIQEHVVRMVVKLLSPPLPSDSSTRGSMSHYLSQMSTLNAILLCVSYVDAVHILSLYGMVPDVAAALMPLCEAFGSMPPPANHRSTIFDETSVYSVFSCAFLCLLRLWKFYRPPQEHCLAGRGGSIRLELTLDYLLLMHNNHNELPNSSASSTYSSSSVGSFEEVSTQPIYIDSFPKLRAWYLQNQACIASTLSGVCNKNPVHQVANKILSMICRKMNKSGIVSSNLSSTSSSSVSGSSLSTSDDSYQRPTVSAWEFLEAVPFVLEAVLTACSHGRISSRDMTTSLRDLVDFLPASLAAIVSYFTAEITRGIWKAVPMNGTEWPSPGAALHSIEDEVKEILASAGVQIHSCYPRGVPPMLPLPMAALVSLTITFKLDRSLEYIHGIIGQALENCAGGSSWPSMPIIGALWAQKVRRWHDFIVLSCMRSPFGRDKDAVAQLIQSCFTSFLHASSSSGSDITASRGVGALMGESITGQGLQLPMAPGFIYLRTCRTFHDTYFVSETILKQVIDCSHKLASGWSSNGPPHLKSGRTPLSGAASMAYQVAMLGAGLLCIAGGPFAVQVLYEETLPTLLLSAREQIMENVGPVSSTLQGYTMANMLFFCGSLLWGSERTSSILKLSFLSRRPRVVGTHMDFIAGVLDGHILLGCEPGTWKAYVSCFVFLLVKFVPSWLLDIKLDTLKKIAAGLRSWHEHDLAISLLERAGPQTISIVVETLLQ
ncbi:mediator of RNA polymerase II transcription subunit 33A-like [Lolium rigidum]|uniref:mediator of RNA polymerase II transcription subunit 33A-like n=1 Tax=Lolium rigidum TaxID=89674 RepID=UPI001F5CC4F2|nr:mediator of RNA polymerase II transcription subunit 33A-like [Lolium rigidum]